MGCSGIPVTLAVEEQFYLLWPLLLRRWSRSHLDVLLFAVIVLSALVAFVVPDALIPGSRSVRFSNLFFVPRWFIPASGPIALGVLTCLHLDRISGWLLGWRHAWVPVLHCAPVWMPDVLSPMTFLVQSAGIALGLVWLLQEQDGGAARFLEWKPLAYMGRITYGIYLYHLLFIAVEHPAAIFHFPFNVLAAIGLAIVSYELVERPILRLKERYQ